MLLLLPLLLLLTSPPTARADECHLTPVIHVLQYPGCIPKPIPSFACTGRCTSYVQVSQSSKPMKFETITSGPTVHCGTRSYGFKPAELKY